MRQASNHQKVLDRWPLTRVPSRPVLPEYRVDTPFPLPSSDGDAPTKAQSVIASARKYRRIREELEKVRAVRA